MPEGGLCWKCLNELLIANARGEKILVYPWTHCHHEPKEKPKEKCWCEKGERLYSGIEKEYVEINFCPECGRKLEVKP